MMDQCSLTHFLSSQQVLPTLDHEEEEGSQALAWDQATVSGEKHLQWLGAEGCRRLAAWASYVKLVVAGTGIVVAQACWWLIVKSIITCLFFFKSLLNLIQHCLFCFTFWCFSL